MFDVTWVKAGHSDWITEVKGSDWKAPHWIRRTSRVKKHSLRFKSFCFSPTNRKHEIAASQTFLNCIWWHLVTSHCLIYFFSGWNVKISFLCMIQTLDHLDASLIYLSCSQNALQKPNTFSKQFKIAFLTHYCINSGYIFSYIKFL